MRLPWPFGRRTPSDGPSADAPEGPAPAGPSASPTETTAPPTGAWSGLPPIQRAVGPAPLVAPAGPFLDEVPGHRPLPPIVQALGHETGPAAPPGLVVAKPSTAPALTSRAPLPLQRHAAPSAPTGAEAEDAWTVDPVAPEPGPGSAPARTLAVVAPAASVTPAPRPLTRAPATTTPVAQRAARGTAPSATIAAGPAAPGAGRAVGVPPAGPGSPGAAPLPSPRGTAPPRAGRWAESTAGPPSIQGAAASPAAASGLPAPASPPPAPAPDGASAPPRRVGLGAPIPAPPAGAVAQRLPMAVPPSRRGAQGIVPSPAAPPPSTLAPEAPPSPVPGGAVPARPPAEPPRPLPVLPVARRAGATATADRAAAELRDIPPAAGARAPGQPHAGGPTAVASVPASSSERLAGPAGPAASRSMPASRPTLGRRPLRPSVSVRREVPDGAGGPAAITPTGAAPVAARWSSAGDLPATVAVVPPPAVAEAPVALQRLAPADGGPAPASPRVPGPARELTFPAPGAQGASPAGSHAGPRQPAVQRAAAGAGPAPAPAAPGGGPRAPLALARPAPPATPAAAAPAPADQAPALQRIVAAPASPVVAPAPVPVVQAVPADSAPAVPAITATPVVQRVDGSAPDAPQAPAGRSERELDELARALYGRIQTRLRTEIIHEREARGLGFDAF